MCFSTFGNQKSSGNLREGKSETAKFFVKVRSNFVDKIIAIRRFLIDERLLKNARRASGRLPARVEFDEVPNNKFLHF